MPGPPPKPTWLKIISGNPGKRPLNTDEPQPIGDLVDPPDWLTPTQQEGWRYAIARAPAGLLKQLDRGIFVVFIVAEDLHREASKKVAQYGSVIKVRGVATPVQSPYVAIQHKQARLMMRAAAELGFSPSSRPRIRLEGSTSKTTANEFDGLRELGDD